MHYSEIKCIPSLQLQGIVYSGFISLSLVFNFPGKRKGNQVKFVSYLTVGVRSLTFLSSAVVLNEWCRQQPEINQFLN